MLEISRKFALEMHKGFTRPNKTQEPYNVHLEEVATLVEASGGNTDEIAAAWLHDIIEDTSVTLDDIQAKFGSSIADIVKGLTDPPNLHSLPILKQKAIQAKKVSQDSVSVKRVKLADQISNVRSVAVDPPTDWSSQKCLDYIEGARLIFHKCRGISNYLDREFENAYQAAHAVHSPT